MNTIYAYRRNYYIIQFKRSYFQTVLKTVWWVSITTFSTFNTPLKIWWLFRTGKGAAAWFESSKILHLCSTFLVSNPNTENAPCIIILPAHLSFPGTENLSSLVQGRRAFRSLTASLQCLAWATKTLKHNL